MHRGVVLAASARTGNSTLTCFWSQAHQHAYIVPAFLPSLLSGSCASPAPPTTSLTLTEVNEVISAWFIHSFFKHARWNKFSLITSLSCSWENRTWHNAPVHFRAKLQNLHRHCFFEICGGKRNCSLHNHSYGLDGNGIFGTSSMALNKQGSIQFSYFSCPVSRLRAQNPVTARLDLDLESSSKWSPLPSETETETDFFNMVNNHSSLHLIFDVYTNLLDSYSKCCIDPKGEFTSTA